MGSLIAIAWEIALGQVIAPSIRATRNEFDSDVGWPLLQRVHYTTQKQDAVRLSISN